MPLSPEDHLAVIDLLAGYARAIDSGDADAYAGNFLEDAVLDRSSGGGSLEGRAAIREWVAGLIDSGHVGGDPATLRHFVGLPLIEGEGDRCTAQTYCVILDFDPDRSIRSPLVGRYEDVCVKVDGRWLFQHRIIHGELRGRRD
jgi:ketosteroid isomerase-like protein